MLPDGVRKALLRDEGKPHEIVMSSGERVVVLNRERWLIGPDYLIVLDPSGDEHNIDYRNIAEVRPWRNGRKRKKQA